MLNKHETGYKDMESEWLTDAYDYDPPRRGQLREGVILKLEEHGAIIDIGLKRDGFVPQTDLERLGKEALAKLKPNQEVTTRVVRPSDQNGNLILSLYETRVEEDWTRVEGLLEHGEISTGTVTGYNRGGLLVKFGYLEGFIPASHLSDQDMRHLSDQQRQSVLQTYVGQELSLKVLEVNRRQERLVLSERLARKQQRQHRIERLLNELVEGDVRRGIVSGLCHFGAFVDLGGAEGLIHISELTWQKVKHPRQVLQVGDEIEVYILHLDHDRRRISLSLKRLQPNPWSLVEEFYSVGQLVAGPVVNLVDFGAFVRLEVGVQGLLHISEMADPPPAKPQEIMRPGDELVLRILRIEPARQRLALSLKSVSEQEREDWLAQHAQNQREAMDETAPALLV